MQGTAAIPDFSPDSSIAAPARQASKSWTRFGVALFDGMEPGPGWTAIDDEPDKVRRIEDITQLRNDVLRWNNITYETFQEAQLDRKIDGEGKSVSVRADTGGSRTHKT